MYKTQQKELKEDLEEKIKQYTDLETDYKNLESERNSLGQQLQLALAKADSEHLARTVAEGELSEAEKQKTMLQLEIKEVAGRNKSELSKMDITISTVSW